MFVKTKFPCESKSVLEFQGIGNGFHLTLMTFRQLTFALGVDDEDDDQDGDEREDDDDDNDDDEATDMIAV